MCLYIVIITAVYLRTVSYVFSILQSAGVSSPPCGDVVIIEFHMISIPHFPTCQSRAKQTSKHQSEAAGVTQRYIHVCVFLTDCSASSVRVLSVFEHDKANKTKEWIFLFSFPLNNRGSLSTYYYIISYVHL